MGRLEGHAVLILVFIGIVKKVGEEETRDRGERKVKDESGG